MNDRVSAINNILLKNIIEPWVGNGITYGSDLSKVGSKLFQNFKGVHPSDQIPQMRHGDSCIINLDKSNQPGSHWIALVRHKKKTIIYDSFGRQSKLILPDVPLSILSTFIDTDTDPEQNILENNCGARCLAFLCIYYKWGVRMAMQL